MVSAGNVKENTLTIPTSMITMARKVALYPHIIPVNLARTLAHKVALYLHIIPVNLAHTLAHKVALYPHIIPVNLAHTLAHKVALSPHIIPVNLAHMVAHKVALYLRLNDVWFYYINPNPFLSPPQLGGFFYAYLRKK